MRRQQKQARAKNTRLVAAMILALGALTVFAVVRLRPPSRASDPGPLNDLAPRPPKVLVTAAEAPWRREAVAVQESDAGVGNRLAAAVVPMAPVTTRPPVLPRDMPDVKNPPQWTQVLAAPSAPSPPDPAKPPPMAVDPEGH